MTFSVPRAAAGFVLAAACALGCGAGADGRVVATGKVVDGARPFAVDASKVKLPPGATGLPPGAKLVAVVLISESGETFPANVADDSTFSVPGPDGKGIKPGRYKVAVTASVGGPDYLGGKFSPEKTQVVREVKSGEELVIDVTKPQG